MNNKSQQLKANLQQQTKRLLDQLKELEENKADLTEEEYIQLKQQTCQSLKTFQNSLNNLLLDPNNSILQSQIEKSKRAIFEAFKSQYNKDEIVDKLLTGQAVGTREQIRQLQKRYHLKSISESDFVGRKRKLIVQIEETGAKLTPQESQWLQLHHHFSQTAGELKEEAQKNQIKIAQSKIQK